MSTLCLLLVLAGGGAHAAESSTWGPARGTEVTVRAADQSGQVQTLATLSGRRGLLIFFNRSADW